MLVKLHFRSLTLDESGIDDVTEKPLVSRIVKHSSWPSQFDNTFSALAQIQVLERAEFKESGVRNLEHYFHGFDGMS